MELEQCWSRYLKAEELIKQGHWPEAYHLYEDVLSSLPQHIQSAVTCHSTKPCQLMCMLDGLRIASINQSEILNNLGKTDEAFSMLNHSYSYFQFLTLESNELLRTINSGLHKHSDALYRHLAAFCSAQKSTDWMVELENIQKSHHHFHQLQTATSFELSNRLN